MGDANARNCSQAVGQCSGSSGTLDFAFYTATFTEGSASTWVSPQVLALTGFTPSQFKSTPKFWASRLHPSDRRRVLRTFSGIRHKSEIKSEYRWLCSDGNYKWFQDRATLSNGLDGEPSILTGVCIDISNQMEGSKRARAKEGLSTWTLDNSPDATLVVSSLGVILFASTQAEALFGYSRDEMLGQSVELLMPERFRSGHLRELEAYFANPMHSPMSARKGFFGLSKSGHEFPIDISLSPFASDGDSLVCCSLRDVSCRELIHEELERSKSIAEAANAAKNDFLAKMSHEIRTPMTAILGFSECLLDPNISNSEKTNCINTINRSGKHLLSIINDILDLSKIEAGRMTIELQDCQPCQIVAEVVSLMRSQAEVKDLSLRVRYKGSIPRVIKTDCTRLRQILVNLLGNAIKFTETGAVCLEVRLIDSGDMPYLEFEVSDSGIGMTSAQAASLFQPFVQADSSIARKYGGTGLGLTVSKYCAELLGGDLTLVDTKAGEGSKFKVVIATGPLDDVPMVEGAMEESNSAQSLGVVAQIVQSDFEGLRILLAEDGLDNQRLISHVLTKAGMEVTVVDNGKIALFTALAAYWEDEPFDCILMDMQMPVMDGYEATRKLREAEYSGPVIALTANAMLHDKEECLEAGCTDFETKPLRRTELLQKIAKLTQRVFILT